MMHDDSQRGGMYNQPRRPFSNYSDNKSPNYSPSTSYNYSPAVGNLGNNGPGGQATRRRVEPQRFKREPINYSEKLVRQNDIIIKLLQEISSKLSSGSDSLLTRNSESIQNDISALAQTKVEKNSEPDNEPTGEVVDNHEEPSAVENPASE